MTGLFEWTMIPTAAGFCFKGGQVLSEAIASYTTKPLTTIPIPHDFFSSIITLGLLAFSQKGTKLYLDGTRFVLHEKSTLQSAMRTFVYRGTLAKQGEIAQVIAYFAAFFKPHESEDAKKILEVAKKGLEQLKSTYEGEKSETDTAKAIIGGWIELLDKALTKPVEIESLTEDKRLYLKTVYDCWFERVHYVAETFREMERLQKNIDPDTALHCEGEKAYLIALQEKQKTVLAETVQNKYRIFS